jgi:F0F1-type ATP synthase epsilon subunit
MTFRMLNIQDVLFETDSAKEIILPVEGEQLAVLDAHQPFVAALSLGIVRVRERKPGQAEEVRDFGVSEGVALLHDNALTVLTEGGIRREEVAA